MTDWDAPYGGEFLEPKEVADWGGAVELTIGSVEYDESTINGQIQKRWILTFDELPDRRWSLNKTNGRVIAAQHGRQVEPWVGKKIILDAKMGDTPRGEQLRLFVREQLAAPVAPAQPTAPAAPPSNTMLAATQAATAQPPAAPPPPAPTNADGDPDDDIPF